MDRNSVTVSKQLEAEGFSKVNERTIRGWMHLPWWIQEVDRMITEGQNVFALELAENGLEIAKGMLAVAKGTDKTDKTANARVQAGKVFSEIGKSPLINRRPQLNIQNNTLINNIPVGESMMKGWTQDQLNEYARTGRKPEEK